MDTKDFVSACPVCCQQKVPCRVLAGYLQPLPAPQRPWSHNSLDFVTGLSLSGGFPTILMVVDGFSKMAHFVPLPKLTSAKKTAELVLQHMFRLPFDVVSDRDPQFTSVFWGGSGGGVGGSAASLEHLQGCPPGSTPIRRPVREA